MGARTSSVEFFWGKRSLVVFLRRLLTPSSLDWKHRQTHTRTRRCTRATRSHFHSEFCSSTDAQSVSDPRIQLQVQMLKISDDKRTVVVCACARVRAPRC